MVSFYFSWYNKKCTGCDNMNEKIIIKGARENNLKNINLTIQIEQL